MINQIFAMEKPIFWPKAFVPISLLIKLIPVSNKMCKMKPNFLYFVLCLLATWFLKSYPCCCSALLLFLLRTNVQLPPFFGFSLVFSMFFIPAIDIGLQCLFVYWFRIAISYLPNLLVVLDLHCCVLVTPLVPSFESKVVVLSLITLDLQICLPWSPCSRTSFLMFIFQKD